MKRLVLISGKQGSGKSTLAQHLGLHTWVTRKHPFVIAYGKFAAPLYQMHDEVLGVLRQFEIETEAVDADLLQLLGTEWGRRKYGENVWVNCFVNWANEWFETRKPGEQPLIVCDDCRFKNEIEVFADDPEVRVLKVRLECPEEIRKARRGAKWRENTNHQSEIDLDDYDDWDLVIDTSREVDIGLVAEMVELLWEVKK